MAVRTVVEVGGWEHECCGPAYERHTRVELTCRAVGPDRDETTTRYVESRHDLPRHGTVRVRGQVVDLAIVHPDGSVEPIERLPSGSALRGFDKHDDGHLEQPWTGAGVDNDSERYLVTVAS